jgi:hypothetical protein
MKLKEIMLVAVIALVPVGVSAAGSKSSDQAMFNKLDTNHDGYISKDEARSNKELTEDWKRADRNRDDKLDESEFSAFEEEQHTNVYHPGGD